MINYNIMCVWAHEMIQVYGLFRPQSSTGTGIIEQNREDKYEKKY